MKIKSKLLLKRSLSILLVIAIIFCTSVVEREKASAASGDIQIDFINDCFNKTGGARTGDATLLNCNGKYVLIDIGHADTYDKYLQKTLKGLKKTNNKVEIEAVIISHNHRDHMGALKKLLDDPAIIVKKIYKTNINDSVTIDNEPMSKICTSKLKKEQIIDVKPKTRERLTLNGTTIDIYGPAKAPGDPIDPKKPDGDKIDVSSETVQNNLSMIVDVKSNKASAIFMGDMSKTGFYYALYEYSNVYIKEKNNTECKNELFKKDSDKYDVCKVGHHGSRNNNASTLETEIDYYNKYIKARYYVLTIAEDKAYEEATRKKCFKTFIKSDGGYTKVDPKNPKNEIPLEPLNGIRLYYKSVNLRARCFIANSSTKEFVLSYL